MIKRLCWSYLAYFTCLEAQPGQQRHMFAPWVYSFNRVAQAWYWDESKKAKEKLRTHMSLLVSFAAVPLAEADYTAKSSIRRALPKWDVQHWGHECSWSTLDKANVQGYFNGRPQVLERGLGRDIALMLKRTLQFFLTRFLKPNHLISCYNLLDL